MQKFGKDEHCQTILMTHDTEMKTKIFEIQESGSRMQYTVRADKTVKPALSGENMRRRIVNTVWHIVK